jgi:hypothetical protein
MVSVPPESVHVRLPVVPLWAKAPKAINSPNNVIKNFFINIYFN